MRGRPGPGFVAPRFDGPTGRWQAGIVADKRRPNWRSWNHGVPTAAGGLTPAGGGSTACCHAGPRCEGRGGAPTTAATPGAVARWL